MDLIKIKRLSAALPGLLMVLLLFSACSSSKKISYRTSKPEKHFAQNPIFSKEFSGFTLYDIQKNRYLANVNGNKHFTPASNTKIFSLYAALSVLKDSLPVVRYSLSGDTMFFSGTGNPLNLNPYFRQNNQLIDFLKDSTRTLVYIPFHPAPVKYGSGWAWDDAFEYYQLENSSLPVYGNEIQLEILNDSFSVSPSFFTGNIQINFAGTDQIETGKERNTFNIKYKKDIDLALPIQMTDELVVELLSDTLDQPVLLQQIPKTPVWETYKIPFPDSLFIRMMQESDNFIAEQLLLMCSLETDGLLDRSVAIQHFRQLMDGRITDDYRWVDGSGLSRYNLFTPQNMAEVLLEIYRLKGIDWIGKVFPSGGISGTIGSWYQPYVLAKTGTLSNNHCLSGYILAKSGKIFIFSFMHNHFLESSRSYKQEMDKLLKMIHEMY
jgi:D-alanyl-D-alanine carboxypeptidase/D-alanyl-D-alanine-endopeptidase (penicillin-binding protein 4)